MPECHVGHAKRAKHPGWPRCMTCSSTQDSVLQKQKSRLQAGGPPFSGLVVKDLLQQGQHGLTGLIDLRQQVRGAQLNSAANFALICGPNTF